jgi:hypothetical protein
MSISTNLASPHRPESQRCITRVVINGPKKTRGWNVRISRHGQRIAKFFSDSKYGGRAGALSEAMHFRDKTEKNLPARLVRKPPGEVTNRNTSGIVGVGKGTQTVRRGGRVHTYVVWTASGMLASGKRKVRHFYVNQNRTEEAAREAAIAQRLRWEALTLRRQKRPSAKET